MILRRQPSTARPTAALALRQAAALLATAGVLSCGEASGQEWLAPVVPASAMRRPVPKGADSQPTSRRRQASTAEDTPDTFQSSQTPLFRINLGRAVRPPADL